jgi:hypothetical protein
MGMFIIIACFRNSSYFDFEIPLIINYSSPSYFINPVIKAGIFLGSIKVNCYNYYSYFTRNPKLNSGSGIPYFIIYF